jgi:hypothetical protein
MRSVRCLRWLQQGGKTGICTFVCAWVAGLGAALYGLLFPSAFALALDDICIMHAADLCGLLNSASLKFSTVNNKIIQMLRAHALALAI